MKRMYPEAPIVGIGVVIVCEGKIVLAQRGNEPSKGKWTVPGGLVELGEQIETAVIREAKEETCLDVENPRLIDVVDNVDYDEAGKIKYHYVIVDYLVTVKEGTLKAASDVVDLKWVAFDEVEKFNLTASFREFFKLNRKRLEKENSY
jgi:8-oxo-dGTP diphosphatase